MSLKTIVTKIPSRDIFLRDTETLAVGYPWLTYGAIIALEAIVSKKMKVLEFGGGGSTIFWARNCQSVKTYETDPEWYAKITQRVADLDLKNVELLYCDRRQTRLGLESEPDNYYDIVLIDSDPRRSTRFNLANQSITKIKIGGWLIIDNYLKFGMSDFDYSGWKVYTFDEFDYRGQGTRLCQKLPNQIL